ncbi:MAG: Mur ligase domain-containing protein [Firmicutes bacterium]|nr:Mur ligase domain-containing protein [Bacillota bacterium]
MNIHFVGARGVSMRQLSLIVNSLGHAVTGSDIVMGAHTPDNIMDADLVVYTSAVGEDNCELSLARKRGIPVIERADFLGCLCRMYQNVIAVSGSHGNAPLL